MSVQWWQYVGLWNVFFVKKWPCPSWMFSSSGIEPSPFGLSPLSLSSAIRLVPWGQYTTQQTSSDNKVPFIRRSFVLLASKAPKFGYSKPYSLNFTLRCRRPFSTGDKSSIIICQSIARLKRGHWYQTETLGIFREASSASRTRELLPSI